jgi:hypothetical protein
VVAARGLPRPVGARREPAAEAVLEAEYVEAA